MKEVMSHLGEVTIGLCTEAIVHRADGSYKTNKKSIMIVCANEEDGDKFTFSFNYSNALDLALNLVDLLKSIDTKEPYSEEKISDNNSLRIV